MINTNYTNGKILVIGDLMLDHYIYGNCNRISPEAPVQVVEVNNDEYTLGGAGNVLKNLKSFKCSPYIISVTGDDEDAVIVQQHLKDADVALDGVLIDSSRCTTVKSRVLASNHQLIRLDRERTHQISEEIVAQLLKVVEQKIDDFDIVLLSDYNKGLLSDTLLKGIFDICRKHGVKTIVDPKGNDYGKYKGANIIKPNKKEAIAASGIIIKDAESLYAASLKIKQITDCDDIIITMSEDGMAMFTNNNLSVIPTKALDVVDVTGAGDTVLAALGLSLAGGSNMQDACDFANHAAAVVVSKVGSATATLEEVEQKFSE